MVVGAAIDASVTRFPTNPVSSAACLISFSP
jgi:hypothetical protein